MIDNKEDYIYNLSYKNQILSFLDDFEFQNEEYELDYPFGLVKVSDMIDQIEELNTIFLHSSDYCSEGLISIPCSLETYELGKVPEIVNIDNSSVYLTHERMAISDSILDDKKHITVKYILNVDISKPLDEICNELHSLELKNTFFDFFKYSSSNMNIKTEREFKGLITSSRLNFLLNDLPFLAIEYYMFRGVLNASIEQTRKAIKNIYGLKVKSKN